MTNNKLTMMVEEAIALDREITAKDERLKELKKAIKIEAESRGDEHQETDTGSSSWSFAVTDGSCVRVNWPIAKLKSSIDGEGKDIETVKKLAGPAFTQLFTPSIVYSLVKDFRISAETLLGTSAKKLIKACESKSSPSVAFETKESTQP